MKHLAGRSRQGVLIGAAVAAAIAASALVVLRSDRTGQGGSGLSQEFSYDLARYRKVDPALLLYEPAGTIATGFAEVHALAVGAGDQLCVAGDSAVNFFDSSGRKTGEWKLPAPVGALAEGPDGSQFVCFKDHVEILDANGKVKARWDSPGEKVTLTSIALAKGHVFVADAGGRVVLHYDASGKLLGRIGQADPGRNIPGFIVPSPYFDVAVGPDGLLWAANTGRRLVEAYTFQGDRELWWGESSPAIEGFSGCCNPANFAILPGGGFVTAEKGLPRVKIYDSAGRFVGVVAGPEQLGEAGAPCVGEGGAECTGHAMDVAVDSAGRVFVLDPYTREVRIFTRKPAPATRDRQS